MTTPDTPVVRLYSGTEERGFIFDCPGCGEKHAVRTSGSGHCWQWNGDTARPTIAPSLLVKSGHYVSTTGDCWCTYEERLGKPAPFTCYICHSFLREGRIEFLSDCTHALAGQTVPLGGGEAA